MKTFQVDAINTGLIILSFLLAYYLPFELFLFAYAVLGPLHYFTEINWIRDKNYFIKNKSWIYLVLISALLISLPALLKLINIESVQQSVFVQKITTEFPIYFNGLLFIALVAAIAFTGFKKKSHQYGIVTLGVVFAVLLHYFPLYHVIIGVFLPTIIHVYFFTLFFMWYGNLKSNNRLGYFNVLLMVMVPLVICFLTIQRSDYFFAETTKDLYTSNGFHRLNANISQILGLSDGTKFFFYESIDLKIQMFIAFAYTYHYLNWFSKTTVIGWHKKLTQKKSIVIFLLWGISVALYFYDYKIGLTLLLFLSFLHVFMEFPLNIISIKAIGRSFVKSKS